MGQSRAAVNVLRPHLKFRDHTVREDGQPWSVILRHFRRYVGDVLV